MSRVGFTILAGLLALASAASTSVRAASPQSSAAQSSTQAADEFLKRYCVSCHNDRLRTGGLVLDGLDTAHAAAHSEVWEKVVRKLRTGSMPPANRPRPDAATYDTIATWFERALDRAAADNPNPGIKPALHRLNRREYQNAIRDLLALDHLPKEMDISVLLPPDDASYGFDNIADALGTSPTLLERYVAAAQKIARLAVGDPTMPLIVDTYKVSPSLPQEDRFDGLPFGTRGGITLTRHFPLDGEYGIRLVLGGGRVTEPHEIEISIDGQRVKTFPLTPPPARGRGATAAADQDQPPPDQPQAPPPPAGQQAYRMTAPPPLQIRQAIKAGTRVITVTFLKKTSAFTEEVVQPFSRSGQATAPQEPAIASVTISGPYAASGAGDTPSRRRIFVCKPEAPAQERACARRIVSTLVRRAYRRPIKEADLQVLMPFFDTGRSERDFDSGIERVLERMLVSPEFLFRIEREPAPSASRVAARIGDASPHVWRVSDIELASRLSFFLWSSIPDDELLDAAERGKLRDEATLGTEVRRMLADPRSVALVDNFAAQWLFLPNVDAATPDPRLFPDFDDGLRQAMRRETELFVESNIRENRSVVEFLTADYTFVNERLARHYGIPHVYGDTFRRVTLPDGSARRGLLGQASILTVTSYAHRTSPVLRGKWMLENILGTPPPPPPPNVPALKETTQAGKALTMREAMEQHRANPACASCHARMDPLGFAFENFDAVGRWRTTSAGSAVDASGALPDGTKFNGVAGLLQQLLQHREQFVGTFTERLLTYAIGRGLEHYDAPAVRGIVRGAASSDYRFASIVTAIVTSTPFQMRASGGATAPAANVVANP
jgi:mono/diheme cytochrome c family protein